MAILKVMNVLNIFILYIMAFYGNFNTVGISSLNNCVIGSSKPSLATCSSLRVKTIDNEIKLETPSITTSYTLTLPNALPSSDSFLQTDVNGILSWGSASAGSNFITQGGNLYSEDIEIGTLDNNSLKLITGGTNTRLEIDETGIVTIPSIALANGLVTIDATGILNNIEATDNNTPSTIVKRDAFGSFGGSASLNVLKDGDTMTGLLNLRGGISMGDRISGGIREDVTDDIFIQSDDYLIECSSVNPKTLYLPNCSDFPGRIFIIMNDSSNTLTILSAGDVLNTFYANDDKINDGTTTSITLEQQYDKIILFSNDKVVGGMWHIL